MDIWDTELPVVPLDDTEIKKAMEGLGLSAEVADFQSVSRVLDDQMADSLVSFMERGCDYPEAIAAQIAVSRIVLLKALRLKEEFEATRH